MSSMLTKKVGTPAIIELNSIANEPNKIAPINMYNGIDYELQNRNI